MFYRCLSIYNFKYKKILKRNYTYSPYYNMYVIINCTTLHMCISWFYEAKFIIAKRRLNITFPNILGNYCLKRNVFRWRRLNKCASIVFNAFLVNKHPPFPAKQLFYFSHITHTDPTYQNSALIFKIKCKIIVKLGTAGSSPYCEIIIRPLLFVIHSWFRRRVLGQYGQFYSRIRLRITI